MTGTGWWTVRSRHEARRLLFWRRPSPMASTPLRVFVTIPEPHPVQHLDGVAKEPASPRWLMRDATASPTQTVNVHLEAIADNWSERGAVFQRHQPKPANGHLKVPARTLGNDPSLAARLRFVLALPLARLLPGRSAAVHWPGQLMPFQLKGVQTLIQRDRILLADDMGLGKTIQSIAAIRILCLQRLVGSALVVVPASLCDQWRREFSKWAPELRTIVIRGVSTDRAWQWRAEVHVAIVGYETLREDLGNSNLPLSHKVWDLVAVDEAQKIKNRDSELSRIVKKLRRRRSWALTGTPLENSLDDLASILEFVDQGNENSTKVYAPGPALLARHKELQLRRKKQDVLTELPPKTVRDVVLPLTARQRAAYDRAETDGVFRLERMGPDVRIQHVLELITRLKEICNFDPESGESAKVADIRDRLETLVTEGHKALVFSQYTDTKFGTGALASALAEYRPLVYTGGLSDTDRRVVIQKFKSTPGCKALILSLRAGGVGLNLQEASYVFHLDRWWNPAVERQAEDRAHRIGQNVPVTVFKYTCEGTIEERIQNVLAQKQRLFEAVIDDVSIDLQSRLTNDELFGLFGLSAPARPVATQRVRSDGLELEERCAAILAGHGWTVARTPRTRDGGVDLVATKIDEVGISATVYVQCKDHARPVSVEVIRELLGVLPPGGNVRPILASPAGVTADAAILAAERNVQIWDDSALSVFETTVVGQSITGT